jgi:hypothetical protein
VERPHRPQARPDLVAVDPTLQLFAEWTTKSDQKSRCPEWANNQRLWQALIDEALPDPSDEKDLYGRPRKLWNALAGKCFIGRSCETAEPQYNCHPEYFPPGKLFAEIRERADRKLEDFLRELDDR